MTAYDFLYLSGALIPNNINQHIEQVIHDTHIQEIIALPIDVLSGFKRRIGFAAALLMILLCSYWMNPQMVLTLIKNFALETYQRISKNKAIVISTHILVKLTPYVLIQILLTKVKLFPLRRQNN